MKKTIIALLFVSGVAYADKKFTMPDLTGKTKAEAEKALADLGNTRNIQWNPMDCGKTAPVNKVCNSLPQPGDEVWSGASKTLYIQEPHEPGAGKGEYSWIVLPDLKGKPVKDAVKLVEGLGAHVNTMPEYGVCAAGTVCRSEPDPGKMHLYTDVLLWFSGDDK